MARILTVGIATLDIINTVDSFPVEDDEVRAVGQVVRRGGNASNTAVVLSQLGHTCSWAGSLADDASAGVVRADLESYGVAMDAVQIVADGCTPTSYVTLNQQNGSRTIVHYRDLPEYTFAQFRQIDLSRFDWLHFEGRNVHETRAMLDDAKQRAPDLPVSVEIEKPREGIECLCADVGLLLYSRAYVMRYVMQHAMQCAETDPTTFLREQHRRLPAAEHVCSWGDMGAWGVGCNGELFHRPALALSQVVDTLGAGDTFNAGIIHGKLSGRVLTDCLRDACQLAAKKCTQQGLQGLQ